MSKYSKRSTISPKQLHHREVLWEGSWVGKTRSRRTEIAYKAGLLGEIAQDINANVIQEVGKCSGCLRKEYVLIRGDLYLGLCVNFFVRRNNLR